MVSRLRNTGQFTLEKQINKNDLYLDYKLIKWCFLDKGVGCDENTFLCISAKMIIFWNFLKVTLVEIEFALAFPQYIL